MAAGFVPERERREINSYQISISIEILLLSSAQLRLSTNHAKVIENLHILRKRNVFFSIRSRLVPFCSVYWWQIKFASFLETNGKIEP